jgi:hypothetical protein
MGHLLWKPSSSGRELPSSAPATMYPHLWARALVTSFLGPESALCLLTLHLDCTLLRGQSVSLSHLCNLYSALHIVRDKGPLFYPPMVLQPVC